MFDTDTLGFAYDMVHQFDAMFGQRNKTFASLVGSKRAPPSLACVHWSSGRCVALEFQSSYSLTLSASSKWPCMSLFIYVLLSFT
jgi:hypothetical protein